MNKHDSSIPLVRRVIALSLLCSVLSLLLLVVSFVSENLVNWLLGLDRDAQAGLRDWCSLVAMFSLALAALLNQHLRQSGRKDGRGR